ncbi:MAG: hypothetical protein IIZ19_05400 [Clostridia bacterium]|nr:hypothetical protein [Clostridia bacterium]
MFCVTPGGAAAYYITEGAAEPYSSVDFKFGFSAARIKTAGPPGELWMKVYDY